MLQRRLATTVLVGAMSGAVTPSFADAPLWESWAQPYPQRGQFAPSRAGELQPQLQLAAYTPPALFGNPIQQGLLDLARLLETKNPWEHAPLGSGIANKTLMDTVRYLLNWQGELVPAALAQQFELIPINSSKGDGAGIFSGYYTPILQGSRFPSAQYNVPIYREPANAHGLTPTAIANGALNSNLAIAWVDDPYLLYIAQVQGSANIRFADGSSSTLDYAGDNGATFRPVSAYLKAKGYNIGSFAHENVGRWLNERPDIMQAALLSNPRYIFFHETQELPQTASGNSVIPGHTIAVDSRYIPHGSVLLAELPRVNNAGKAIGGSEWRLLFAQDHGRAIQGNGRIDLYTGVGNTAESAAYSVSGIHQAFMLVRKAG
jgi:membrane-bound lytic murein transglycosylase A